MNYKTIDIHCHSPLIEALTSPTLLSEFGLLQKIALRFYLRALKIKPDKNPRKILGRLKAKFINLINESKIDHFVVLALDGVYSKDGELLKRGNHFYTSNESVYELAEKNRKIIAGPSINPMRKDAFEELEKAHDKKAALIKIHPCIQLFDPASPKYRKFFATAAKYKIPVLIHIGQEYALPGIRKEMNYSRLEKLAPLLETGCKVIAAHGCGYSILNERKDFNKVLELLRKYKNFYLDNSALSTGHRKKRAFSIINDTLALERTVFGTDFPVCPSAEAFVTNLGLKKVSVLKEINNPLNRDLEIKKAIGFPPETFSRGYEVINSNVF